MLPWDVLIFFVLEPQSLCCHNMSIWIGNLLSQCHGELWLVNWFKLKKHLMVLVYLTLHAAQTIYKVMILPLLVYCNNIFIDMSPHKKHQFEKIQFQCLKIIYGKRNSVKLSSINYITKKCVQLKFSNVWTEFLHLIVKNTLNVWITAKALMETIIDYCLQKQNLKQAEIHLHFWVLRFLTNFPTIWRLSHRQLNSRVPAKTLTLTINF